MKAKSLCLSPKEKLLGKILVTSLKHMPTVHQSLWSRQGFCWTRAVPTSTSKFEYCDWEPQQPHDWNAGEEIP